MLSSEGSSLRLEGKDLFRQFGEAVGHSEFSVPFKSDPDPDGVGGSNSFLMVDTDFLAVSKVEHLVRVQSRVVDTEIKKNNY